MRFLSVQLSANIEDLAIFRGTVPDASMHIVPGQDVEYTLLQPICSSNRSHAGKR